MKKQFLTLLAASLLTVSCASYSKSITPIHVASEKYHGHTCTQLKADMAGIGVNVQNLSQAQDKLADKDKASTIASMIFLPAGILLAAGDDKEEELAQLKGEYEAVKRAAIGKKCDFINDLEDQLRQRQNKETADNQKKQRALNKEQNAR